MLPKVNDGSIAGMVGDMDGAQNAHEFRRLLRETCIVEQPLLYIFLDRQCAMLNEGMSTVGVSQMTEDGEWDEESTEQCEDVEYMEPGELYMEGALLSWWLLRSADQAHAMELEAEVAEHVAEILRKERRPWWKKALGSMK
jgi:hypothetical protein